MVDTNTEVLQAAAQETFNRDLNGAAQLATGLNLDLNGICQRLWNSDVNANFDNLLTLVSQHAMLSGPGYWGITTTSADFASTPDHAAFAVTDIDVRWYGAGLWGAVFLSNHLFSQPGAWAMSLHPNRASRFANISDGIGTIVGAESSTTFDPVTFAGNTAHWHRCTLDVDNGASGHTRTYFTSEDGTNWTQMGTPIVGTPATLIFNSTGVMRIPGDPFWGGRIYYAEVRNGINGTIVANPDFRIQAPGTTSFADSTGKTWTLQGNARIV